MPSPTFAESPIVGNSVGAAPGVTCVFAVDRAAALAELVAAADAADRRRLVAGRLALQTALGGDVPGALCGVLAEAAAAWWPAWGEPAGTLGLADPARPARLAGRALARAIGADAAWCAAAVAAARAGRDPRPAGFPNAAHARGFAALLAIDGVPPTVAVTVDSVTVEPGAGESGAGEPDAAGLPSGALLALARGLEWLAGVAGVRVVALLPAAWAGRDDLDAVNPGAIRHGVPADMASPQADSPSPPAGSPDADLFPAGSSEERDARDEPARHVVTPLIGRPHPGSPGEVAMAGFLAGDDELAGLFRFNRPVTTTRGSRFTVDLLWEAGRVVVEIDGYGWHSGRAAFAADRARDYELTVSGYRVLRLPHDLVVSDVALAAARVRDLVRFVRSAA